MTATSHGAAHRHPRRRPYRPHARRAARAPRPRRALSPASTTSAPSRPTRRPPPSACQVAAQPASADRADDVDAVAICSSTDTHVDLIVAAAAGGQGDLLREAGSLDLAEVDRALAAVDAGRRPVSRSASTAASTLAPGGARRGSTPARSASSQHVRITSRDPAPPPLAYIEVSGGIFRDMTIHDFDMARFVTGARSSRCTRRGAIRDRPGDRRGRRRRHRRGRARATPNGVPDHIDNSRQAVYGYDQRVEVFGSGGMAASENPLAHTRRACARPTGARSRGAAVLLPRALHAELPCRAETRSCDAVRDAARRRRVTVGDALQAFRVADAASSRAPRAGSRAPRRGPTLSCPSRDWRPALPPRR